jgi:HEAT repeat protein
MLMSRFLFIFFIIAFIHQLIGNEGDTCHQIVRRIEAHLLIKDLPSAYQEAKQAFILYPDNQMIHEAYIRATARLGYEKEMLLAWQKYFKRFPDPINRQLVEEMAWGVLDKASQSHSLITRQLALLAAFFCNDSKGVEILFQGMQDCNYAIRAFAVKLASQLHDEKLICLIKQLFYSEKVPLVRYEVIKAIGTMKIFELKDELELFISSEQNLSEEKALAIQSLVSLLDAPQREEIVHLTQSNRVGLRLVACESIAHFQSIRDLDQLLILTGDYHPDVKMASYQALGMMKPTKHKDIILEAARKGIKDHHFKVALSAAWVLMLYQEEEAKEVLERYLLSSKAEVRLIASAALAQSGKAGINLASRFFKTHTDPYVRLNLACGLVKQRVHLKSASQVIKQVLVSQKEKFCEVTCGIFNPIASTYYHQSEEVSEHPEMDNQLLRLEWFNLL